MCVLHHDDDDDVCVCLSSAREKIFFVLFLQKKCKNCSHQLISSGNCLQGPMIKKRSAKGHIRSKRALEVEGEDETEASALSRVSELREEQQERKRCVHSYHEGNAQ